MHTQQLVCFLCVADKLNFTKAAEELFLSTPTVTHHIKTLENELGTTLFHRNSKMVRLTESGMQFYRDAQEILSRIELAEKRVRRIADPDTFHLKIGCSSTAELSLLEDPLTRLRESYPGIYPQLTVCDILSLRNAFDNDQIDLIFSTKSTKKRHPKSAFLPINTITNHAVFLRSSPLSKKEELHYEDVLDKRLITLHPKLIPFEYPNRIRDKLLNHGLSHLDIHCQNDQAAILLAACDYGIAILPQQCISELPESLVQRPFERDTFSLEYGIIYHTEAKTTAIRQFLDLFTTE